VEIVKTRELALLGRHTDRYSEVFEKISSLSSLLEWKSKV